MFIVEAFFSKAARALRGTRADKVGAETAPKHAPWKAGLNVNVVTSMYLFIDDALC